MKELGIGEILKNPKFAIRILGGTDQIAKESLIEMFPFVEFSLNALFNRPNRLETVKDLFGLYADRTPGEKNLVYAVCHAGSQTYPCIESGTNVNNAKNTTGFLVLIPVPYLDDYTNASDQHPIKLIQMYINAISTLNPGHKKLTDKEKLAYVSSRLRIIIGLNVKDDHRDISPLQTSWRNRQRVCESATRLNQEIRKHNYPAWIVPLVWGIDFVKGKEVYHHVGDFRWLNSTADQIREHCRLLRDNIDKPDLSFPYATVRSVLIESAVSVHMLNELKTQCQSVYYCSGDADLVSLSPDNSDQSVFNVIFKDMPGQSEMSEKIVRLGGAYGFDNEDIEGNIKSLISVYSFEMPQLYMQKSVLLTQLVRTVDICIRKILSTIEPGLAYFSEAHCYINTDLFPNESWKLRNSKLSMPDITSEVTRVIKNENNSKVKSGNGVISHQLFFAQRSAQLITSSRKNIIIVLPNSDKLPGIKKDVAQVINEKDLYENYEEIRNIVTFPHNTQARSKQLNARFLESGYGKNGFHNFVKELPTHFFPFVKFFFAKKEDYDTALKQIATVNLNAEAYLGPKELLSTFQYLLNAIIYHTEDECLTKTNPEIKEKLEPIYKELLENLTSVRSKQNLVIILDAFCRIESLLRWLFLMIKQIAEFTNEVELGKNFYGTVDAISNILEEWSDQIDGDLAGMFYGMTRAILDTNSVSHSEKQSIITNSLRMFGSKPTYQEILKERSIGSTQYK